MTRTGLLDGKVAIVTGAGTGLGRSHALALAAAGATVVVNNRVGRERPSSAELVAGEIEAAGGRALVDQASVTDWAAMGRLVERAVEECGSLDIVINNAGILVWELIADTDEAAFDELVAINVKGAFALTHHACAHWRALAMQGERASGRIINTVSGIGLYGFPRGGLYGLSKGAILSLTMVTAMEMRPYGVTANAIWPEARTRMGKGIFPEAPEEPGAFDPYDPANISPLAVYLASDRGGWLTGQVVYIQGDRIRRMEAWRVAGEHHTAGGRSFDVDELGDALPLLYGTLPTLQPETSLADATEGIDPGRPDGAEAEVGVS
jgi:NAD(P)-dependent dehydrogenase (short-subunit alcohol dehydrogenase family)